MTQDQIDKIFNRQLQLAQQFGAIEETNTGLPFKEIPNNLISYRGQFVLRFMLTCVYDELWEADEVPQQERETHLEELADVLHYVVEICLRVSIWPHSQPWKMGLLKPHYVMGRMMHGLKAKPWKVNPKPTDVLALQYDAQDLFWCFLRYVESFDFTDDQLYEAYFAKAKVNQQRIDVGA